MAKTKNLTKHGNSDHQIDQQIHHNYHCKMGYLSKCNFRNRPAKRPADDQQPTNSRPTDDQQMTTNKNDKEYIKNKKEKMPVVQPKNDFTTGILHIEDCYNPSSKVFAKLIKQIRKNGIH